MNYILMAIPGFLILILLELGWARYKQLDVYRLNDSTNSLALGMISRITRILYAAIPFSFYIYAHEHFALYHWENTLWTWVFAFIVYDLGYYWNHRLGHTMNIGWASHVIHHSSEEYNLTTALRQTSIPNIVGWVFYMPLAFLGIDPVIFASVAALNLLYQFWVHTQTIKRMPNWYEAIFVTPSNHRVHHAKNKIYVDRNYGGVFIVWDRIFNTFQPELNNEPVVFGISTQLKSWNPIWGNLHFITQLMKDAWNTNNYSDKFTLWFRRTGYRPHDVEQRFPITKSNEQIEKYDSNLSKTEQWYVFTQLAINFLWVFGFLNLAANLPIQTHFIFGGVLLFSLYSLGLVQERKPWRLYCEIIKFSLVAIAMTTQLQIPTWVEFINLTAGIASCFTLYTTMRLSAHSTSQAETN
ncbi:sterol desaturase family protein [Bermanella marisrubri]|uniref:Fatty acid hydroxylase domain-containing protein n=1 Tax=Bermanella marisrubri TaxID=207949 RepID=Q1N4T4_9GAMM|nr:sterol desaturase family protein [Bermanella marisrubri]EAT13344.1 hypothetical protein RED65_01250 [Oceanobacter sp. RED65] [Bermanella marisrubri]QIZ84100.1 sterol desaturase family protein [Bermanella marisrubri]